MKNLILSKNGLYIIALVAGLSIYIVDLTILNIVGLVAPTIAGWLDEVILLVATLVLVGFSWFKYKEIWQAFPLVLISLFGFSVIPTIGFALTVDTYPAKVTTAGLTESKGGKENMFQATVVPVNADDEDKNIHRAQDAKILWPVLWWNRSSDTRALLEEAKNTQSVVCVTSYGIRSGWFSQFPNVVEVKPGCDQ